MGRVRAQPAAGPTGWFWELEVAPGTHLVLPDGVMDLIWDGRTLMLAGPDTTAAPVEYPDGVMAWGVRLAPGVAHQALGIPADELLGARADLRELLPVPDQMIDVLHAAPAAGLRDVVRTLLRCAPIDPKQLQLASSIDQAARAGLSVRAIAEQHHLAERTLRRLSHQLFGYGPKTLKSIHRFQRALHLARSGTPLAQVAASAGYADQAHLAREVRRLAGDTLSGLLDRPDDWEHTGDTVERDR